MTSDGKSVFLLLVSKSVCLLVVSKSVCLLLPTITILELVFTMMRSVHREAAAAGMTWT